MTGHKNDSMLHDQVKKHMQQLKSPADKSLFLLGLINRIINFHPYDEEQGEGFYTEEWSEKIIELIDALDFFCSSLKKVNRVLEYYNDKLGELRAENESLLEEIEVLKTKLKNEKSNIEHLLDEKMSLEENLKTCERIKEIENVITEIPFIRSVLKEHKGFIAAVDINNYRFTELYDQLKAGLEELEQNIEEYVKGKESAVEEVKDKNKR